MKPCIFRSFSEEKPRVAAALRMYGVGTDTLEEAPYKLYIVACKLQFKNIDKYKDNE